MWTLRRASIQLKNRGLSHRATQILDVNSEIGSCFLGNHNLTSVGPGGELFNSFFSPTKFYNTSSNNSSRLHMGICTFSSQAGAKNTGEEDDDLEDAFSELEASSEKDDDSIPELDLSENEGVEDDLIDELDVLESPIKSPRVSDASGIAKAIFEARSSSVGSVMDKWIEDGKEVTLEEASLAMQHLRKRRLFVKALQLSEWLEATKKIDFGEGNYASRLDLIAKVRGIVKAEIYLKSIPQSFKGELVYRTLLANCVAAVHIKKSEEVFNKMKDLGLPLTCFTCNQLILLYKRVDRKKIADVLLLMEKENIKPTIFTYWLLIDVKGMAKDVSGMEQIVETMKSEGLKPNSRVQTALARHYIAAGLKDKAENILKELEGSDIENNRWVYKLLLPIYASLKNKEEVARIWKMCESDARLDECSAAIGAWGQLGKIENAEAAFEKLLKRAPKPHPRLYTPMLYVYTDHKLLTKGKDLMRRMMERGCKISSLTWDALVKLYVGAGEVEKANSMLEKALKEKGKNKPLFTTFYAVLEQYGNRGDIRNAEEVFLKMRRAGYVSRLRPYEPLLNAYVNAKVPAYGFRERMKADNVFPNRFLTSLLAKADKLRNSAAADLLE